MFYSFNERVARAAIEAGVHSVDLGGHIGGVTEKILDLHEEAKAKGVTIIPDLGVAPGMVNILAGYGASKLDEVESIKLFVGGIPTEPKPPLHYTRVFSLDGVFDHYTEPSKRFRRASLKKFHPYQALNLFILMILVCLRHFIHLVVSPHCIRHSRMSAH